MAEAQKAVKEKEQAVKQAIASMSLDGILVSSECVDKVLKKQQTKVKVLNLKDKTYEKRLR